MHHPNRHELCNWLQHASRTAGGLQTLTAILLAAISAPSWGDGLTEADRLWLDDHRELRVGIAPAWAPFEYIDEDDAHAGITSDYIRILNDELGLQMTVVPGLTWDEILQRARSGGIDVIPAIMVTRERSKYLSFTLPYLSVQSVIVTRKAFPHVEDVQDLRGRRVVIVKAYAMQQLIENDLPGQELMFVDRMDEAFLAVANGDADATVVALTVFEYFERKLDLADLKVAAVTPYVIEISIGVRKQLEPLVPILNESLGRFTDQEKELIRDKWLNLRVERQVDWAKTVMWGSLPFLIIALVAISIQRTNRRLAIEITEHRRTERALQESIAVRKEAEVALRYAVEEAEAANRAKTEFLANMSHEFRTPLNSILGYAQILGKEETLSDQQSSGLETIQHSGEHLLALINDVLDMSKIEAGRMELEPSEFSIPEMLDNLAHIFRMRAEEKGIRFDYSASTDLPIGVWSDQKKLRQVLINLIGNGVKFTEAGQVSLKVSRQGERVRFQVIDTGIGIAPESLGEIFDPFKHAGDQRMYSEGTGLGLPISLQLVEMLGGHLQVESELGTGSVFWFDLELEEVSGFNPVAKLPQRPITGYLGPRRRVLVVDDEIESRRLLVDLLGPVGFDVREAVGGRDGVDQAVSWRPDVLLMDLRMPGMGGDERLPDTTMVTVVVSASVFAADRDKSVAVGATDFLAKPFHEDQLLEMLRIHLDLEWEHGEGIAEKESANVEQPIVPPDEDVLVAFLDLARSGNMLEIQRRAARLQEENVAYAPFVEKVTTLARQFNVNAVQDFIQEVGGKSG